MAIRFDRYPGLIYPGLYKTIYIAPLQRGVQIVRLFIPNHDIRYSPYSAYHRYDGLSIYRRLSHIVRQRKMGGYRKNTHYPYWHIYTYAGYKGLMV